MDDKLDGNKNIGIVHHTYHVRFMGNLQNLNSVYLWIELLPQAKHLLNEPFFYWKKQCKNYKIISI
jgi:hypothetical protein